MSDANAFAFGKFIPGFDFLQQLSSAQKAGGASLPGLGQWVAPTVNVEELDRRIKELKAVQFWLDQNATALKATIQALEVQKMTLATLQGMNVSMAEVAKAFTVPVPPAAAPAPAPSPAPSAEPAAAAGTPHWPFAEPAVAPAPVPAPTPAPAPMPEAPAAAPEPAPSRARKPKASAAADADVVHEAGSAAAKTLADGVQWWGALTQQFQQIAANALREAAPAKGATPAAAATGAKPARKAAAKKKPAAKRAASKPAARQKAAAPAKKGAKRDATAASARGAGWPLPPAKPR